MALIVKSSSTRRRAVVSSLISAAALALVATPIAMADNQILPRPGDGPADGAIQQLQSAGYVVSINWLEGTPNVPLRECKVTGISGLKVSTTTTDVMMMTVEPHLETAYVDVSCPNAK